MSASGWVGRRASIACPEHNSDTVRNILKILGTIIKWGEAECHVQE